MAAVSVGRGSKALYGGCSYKKEEGASVLRHSE